VPKSNNLSHRTLRKEKDKKNVCKKSRRHNLKRIPEIVSKFQRILSLDRRKIRENMSKSLVPKILRQRPMTFRKISRRKV
jgi:hypothetical protein